MIIRVCVSSDALHWLTLTNLQAENCANKSLSDFTAGKERPSIMTSQCVYIYHHANCKMLYAPPTHHQLTTNTSTHERTLHSTIFTFPHFFTTSDLRYHSQWLHSTEPHSRDTRLQHQTAKSTAPRPIHTSRITKPTTLSASHLLKIQLRRAALVSMEAEEASSSSDGESSDEGEDIDLDADDFEEEKEDGVDEYEEDGVVVVGGGDDDEDEDGYEDEDEEYEEGYEGEEDGVMSDEKDDGIVSDEEFDE
jgi:electron transfer flavoprotein alpha subunit